MCFTTVVFLPQNDKLRLIMKKNIKQIQTEGLCDQTCLDHQKLKKLLQPKRALGDMTTTCHVVS